MRPARDFQRIEQKWGFGMAPIKPDVQRRRAISARTVIETLTVGRHATLGRLDDLSDVKGLFTRTWKRDQWDWFTVWTQLGFPTNRDARRVSSGLLDLRRAVQAVDPVAFDHAAAQLRAAKLIPALEGYLAGTHKAAPGCGFIYVLSTREQPLLLKIGYTDRDVATRVREINSATGVIVPFGARGAWQVPDARGVEGEIHRRLARYRLRADREFFHVDFAIAAKVIGDYVEEISTPASARTQPQPSSTRGHANAQLRMVPESGQPGRSCEG